MSGLQIKRGAAAGLPLERTKGPRAVTAGGDVVILAPVKAAPAPWSGKRARAMDGETLLRSMVAACLAQIRPNAESIAHGSRDPGHVHQLRVGLRRLRSAVRGMAPFAAAMPHGWEPVVMPLFEALGQSRDRHVRSTSLAPKLRAAGAAVVDDAPPSEQDTRAIARRVRAENFQAMLARLAAFAGAAGAAGRGGDGSGLEHLVGRLARLNRQVTRAARHFDELPFEEQHRARKRLKRLRYLAEFAAPAFAPHDVRRWMRRVGPAQDALGRHVDLVLADRHFAALAVTDPDAWFAVGWLRAQSGHSARAARKALRELGQADAFW